MGAAACCPSSRYKNRPFAPLRRAAFRAGLTTYNTREVCEVARARNQDEAHDEAERRFHQRGRIARSATSVALIAYTRHEHRRTRHQDDHHLAADRCGKPDG